MLSYDEIIERTVSFVKTSLSNAEGWHDRWHIYRVWKSAKHIASQEKVNILVVELWALLHDIADSKFHGWDEDIGPKTAKIFLQWLEVDQEIITHVENIVRYISFKWWNNTQSFRSPELDVVQDADRLDAIWAIWIARTFNYGWHMWRTLYDPTIQPNLTMTKEEYKNSTAPTLNHFYEKLLLLKDLMHTTTWKEIAQQRHAFMELYLEQFYNEREWKK